MPIDPAVIGRRTNRRVFTAHLIGERGHTKRLLHALNDVEGNNRGLHQHHVGPFRQIEGNLAQRLIAIGTIHLIRFFIGRAERQAAAERIAKRSIKCRRILGRIGKNGRVLPTGAVERPADRTHSAVHHIRRRHDVAAGCGQQAGLLGEHLDGLIVEDASSLQQAVVAVAGVGVERHVADDADRIAAVFLNRPHRATDEIVRVQRMPRIERFMRLFHNGKESHSRDAESFGFTNRLDNSLD